MKIEAVDIKSAITKMGMLKYFPTDEDVRAEIGALLARMCPHLEALHWLTRALIDGVGEWPGPAELRRMLASRYRLADGDEGDAPVLAPEDIDWSRFPSHADERALPPAAPKLLEAAAGELATIPDRPEHEIFSEVLQHFSKPWPRPEPKLEGQLRARDEELARQIAESGRKLTEAQKAARLAEVESALGRQA